MRHVLIGSPTKWNGDQKSPQGNSNLVGLWPVFSISEIKASERKWQNLISMVLALKFCSEHPSAVQAKWGTTTVRQAGKVEMQNNLNGFQRVP